MKRDLIYLILIVAAIAAVKVAVVMQPLIPLLRVLEYEYNFSFFRYSFAGYCKLGVRQVKRADNKSSCGSVSH